MINRHGQNLFCPFFIIIGNGGLKMIISHYEDKDTLMQQFNSDENMGLSSLQVEENRKK